MNRVTRVDAIFISLVIIVMGLLVGYIEYKSYLIEEKDKYINDLERRMMELDFDNGILKSKFDKGIKLQEGEYHPPVDYPIITSGLGLRVSPITGFESIHYGHDMFSNMTMNVYAVQDGEVVNHYPAPNGYHKGHDIFGGFIEIKHENGISSYAHMAKTFVSEGQEVQAGDVIGIIGQTGLSVGKHLHFSYLIDIFKGIK